MWSSASSLLKFKLIVLVLFFGENLWALSLQDCHSSYIVSQQVRAAQIHKFLDCTAKTDRLSKLGAQWIVLQKARVKFVDSNQQNWSYQIATNPMEPNQYHYIQFNFQKYSNDRSSFNQLIHELENEIFPQALAGFGSAVINNQIAWSYESTMHQLISFMDTPLSHWRRKETAKVHYLGTLYESENFPGNWFENARIDFPVLNTLVTGDANWSQTRHTMRNEFSTCKTACFARQERKITQSLLVALEHPDFIRKVHFEALSDFGPMTGEFARVQLSLPRQFGCYADYPHNDSPTGIRSYDFSFTGQDSQFLDLIPYGKWAIIGRALYIEAINKTQIKQSVERVRARHNGRSFDDAPAHYSGQNAIIRAISGAAVESLARLGGLGGSSEIEAIDGRVVQNLGISADQAIEKYLRHASYLFADYQRKKYYGESVSGHPVTTEPFFTETIISKGYSLRTWADILSKLNPPVFYHIFAYDYEFRPRSGVPWRSYYDRILKVIEEKFETTKL